MNDNNNRGAVWPNDKRENGSKQPHWTGKATIDGVEYWVSAWKKSADAKEGAPSISFAFKPKDEAPTKSAARHESPEFLDDDIPF